MLNNFLDQWGHQIFLDVNVGHGTKKVKKHWFRVRHPGSRR
jgi:hypothetical protein